MFEINDGYGMLEEQAFAIELLEESAETLRGSIQQVWLARRQALPQSGVLRFSGCEFSGSFARSFCEGLVQFFMIGNCIKTMQNCVDSLFVFQRRVDFC